MAAQQALRPSPKLMFWFMAPAVEHGIGN